MVNAYMLHRSVLHFTCPDLLFVFGDFERDWMKQIVTVIYPRI